jgi:hypothetical protein
MKTPILFLIFNRPELTQKTFRKIREVRPEKLFIAADGPREDNSKDEQKCVETRNIIKNINWPCEVKTLFREKNMGCKYAVSSAIDWFFENVDEGIILEDDCMPNKSFFKFCEKMLEKYRNKEKIMHISGSTNKINLDMKTNYYFSHIAYIWGWATWKRAWKDYNPNPNLEKIDIYNNKKVNDFWNSLFNKIVNEKIDTWDAQWLYAIMKNRGLCITPTINMVENIGFGEEATHTNFVIKNINEAREIENNIIYPKEIWVNKKIDEFITKKYYIKSIYQKIIWKIKKIIKI